MVIFIIQYIFQILSNLQLFGQLTNTFLALKYASSIVMPQWSIFYVISKIYFINFIHYKHLITVILLFLTMYINNQGKVC